MAAPGNKFFIQEKLKQVAPHHESFKALWETKWKQPCERGVYPFMYAAVADFQPVVDTIVAKGLKRPYDWDEYAQCFFPKAEELVARAKDAEGEGNPEKASELYLRASALYRIARFPAPRSEKQRYAWEKGKEATIKGLGLERYPSVEVEIPHVHAANGDGKVLLGYYHLPAEASSSHKAPLVIIFCGLDAYRTDLTVWKNGWAQLGCATLIVEIPGTGDNPGAPSDPSSPDRVWSSMFDWVAKQGGIDQTRIVNWGFSTGGHYSIRVAHTHADKLKGVVAHGGGSHHMFNPKWLDAVDDLEYPFDLAHTLCHKFRYADFEQFKEEAQGKFSLLSTGILEKPCTRLLLVNGTEDEIFPIDDYYLCLLHGGPKEARFVPGTKHMGEPDSYFVILKWIFELLDIQGDVNQFLSTVPSKPKY
ncbi:yellowish-green 1-like protein [Hypoxylon sp. FL1857]|nr:yellowish-green 1-like protein [Hypoxylon sp. FL1857]